MKIRSILKICLTVVVLLFVGFSQTGSLQQNKMKILGVSVKGNETISDNSVRIQSGLVSGEKVGREDISQAIRKLWNLNLFSNIQVYQQKQTSEGVFLVIEVEEYPRISRLVIEGNDVINDDKIREESGVIVGGVLTQSKLSKLKRTIKKLYKEKGFLRVEVSEELVDSKRGNRKKVILHVDENEKVRIDEIKLIGNENFSDWRLHRIMKTNERFLWFLHFGRYKEKKYKKDKQRLRDFYQKNGYRDFEIVKDSLYYTQNKKRLNIKMVFSEGPKYKYNKITFSGNDKYSRERLLNLLDIKPGDWYNKAKFEKNKNQRLSALYMNNGYLFTNIQVDEVPVGEDEVNVHLKINKGQKVKVDEIVISGNDKTYENVIRRNLEIYPGQLFDRSKLKRSIRELHMMRYFSKVKPNVIPQNQEKVDLKINVKEKSSDRLNFSLSYSQVNGLIGGGGVTINNFLGRGQQLKFNYQRGTRYRFGTGAGSTGAYQSMSLGFTEPWAFGTPNLVGANFSFRQQGSGYANYYPFDLTSIGGNLRYGRRFRWPDNYFQGRWSIGYHKKEYDNINSSYYENTLKQRLRGRKKLTSVQLRQVISRDSRDMPKFPTQGSVFRLTSTIAGGPLGGNEGYHKHKLSFKFFSPIFRKLVLMNHAQLGAINRIGEEGIVPPEEGFIMGGAGMIYGIALRGYEDNRVGPLYSSDQQSYYIRGGKSMLKYSTELRFSISKQPTIFALAFAEAGNVWTSVENTDPFDLKKSAGIGARFILPQVGTIGLDYGYGFDNIDPQGFGGASGWKMHFIFGRSL